MVEIHKSMDDPYFIIPALAEKKGNASTRLWRPEPMEHAQWLTVIRRVMGMVGAGQQEIKEFTFNSARRFMPTAAHVLGFPADTRQAIGSWEELPEGQGTQRGQMKRSMGIHYSADRAAASARAKKDVLDAFVEACANHPAVASTLTGLPARVPKGDLTWRVVSAQMRPGFPSAAWRARLARRL